MGWCLLTAPSLCAGSSLLTGPEGLMAKERENLKRLKCLRRYRQRYGVEALLHRQLKERRMLATDGAAQQVRPAARAPGLAGATAPLGSWVSPLVPSGGDPRPGLPWPCRIVPFRRDSEVLAGSLGIHTLAEALEVPKVILNRHRNCKSSVVGLGNLPF